MHGSMLKDDKSLETNCLNLWSLMEAHLLASLHGARLQSVSGWSYNCSLTLTHGVSMYY